MQCRKGAAGLEGSGALQELELGLHRGIATDRRFESSAAHNRRRQYLIAQRVTQRPDFPDVRSVHDIPLCNIAIVDPAD
jgi:hypothetical protein